MTSHLDPTTIYEGEKLRDAFLSILNLKWKIPVSLLSLRKDKADFSVMYETQGIQLRWFGLDDDGTTLEINIIIEPVNDKLDYSKVNWDEIYPLLVPEGYNLLYGRVEEYLDQCFVKCILDGY